MLHAQEKAWKYFHNFFQVSEKDNSTYKNAFTGLPSLGKPLSCEVTHQQVEAVESLSPNNSVCIYALCKKKKTPKHPQLTGTF